MARVSNGLSLDEKYERNEALIDGLIDTTRIEMLAFPCVHEAVAALELSLMHGNARDQLCTVVAHLLVRAASERNEKGKNGER